MKIEILLVAFFLSAALVVMGRAAQTPNPQKTLSTASFECPIPAGWTSQGKEEEAIFTGPVYKKKLAAKIWIRHVPPEHPLYETVAAYMERHTREPDVPSPGWKIGKVEEILVGGRKAQRLVSDMSEFIPPSSMDTEEILTREEHVAVPAAKGFYVLVYSAPRPLFAKNRAAFAKVMSGFKPKL